MSAPALQAHYYAHLHSPLKDRLLHFRESHRPFQMTSEQGSWTYLAGGAGAITLVLLPGGLGVAEPWFDCMLEWERSFRVIAISYPCIPNVNSAVNAISAVLERERASRCGLLGTSLGGEIGQAFLRDRPGELDSLILGNTGEANAKYGKKLQRLMPVTKLFQNGLAFSLIKRMAKKRVMSLLTPYISGDELAFWEAYMKDIIDNQYSPDLMKSQFNVLRDFACNYGGPIPAPPRTRTMIIEALDDKMFPGPRRQNLKALFPGAPVQTFAEGGHLLPITRRDQYVARVRDFIVAS